MKKRILSILLTLCMVLTMMPATVFAADGEVAARASETGGLYEHHEACGANSAGASDTMMPKTRSGAVRPAATQYTYTLHYDANGGSGAPPSQSVISSEFHVWVPISDKIPTRDGYTFMGWANSRTGKPIYGGNGGYTECLVVHGYDMSTTIYAIWEVHNHSWGEWTSNGNGTHTRTCIADSSHTETGNCSGGKATSTEKAVCETCHKAYGELLQPAKTVITTPPTLRLPAYVGNEYTDKALMGGEAKAEGTDTVVPGTFGFKYYEGGRVHPGENRMVILFTPKDTEAYTTAECILTVVGTKRTITRVPDDVIITDKPIGTAFEDLGLPLFPFGVKVETNTGASYSPVPVTWDGSTYDPNKYGEQIITGKLHVERSGFTDDLEPTSTVKATARITLIDDRVFTPTLEPPTYSKQLYGGDLCFLVFADKYLSGGTATVNGETVSGKFTLDKDQKIYGHSLTASTLLQAGQLQLKIIFTPDNTIFTWRKLQVGTYNDEVGTLVGGVAKVKGTDTVAPGTFSFKNAPPFYLQTPGEHDVTVVFTPDDLRLHKPTEITIKINAIKNTIRNIDEPDPITDKPFGTPFAELGLPENVCINAVDGAWRWVDVAWDESSYDAESVDWQTITGTPVLSNDDGDIFQQPEPAVTAAIRVKLIDNRPPMPPTIVAESLPDGMEGEAYSSRLTAKGTAPITWSIVSGVLPEGLSLNEDTGEISGTPAGEGTEVFTVMAVNALGEDIKEFSITIAKAPETEYAVIVRDDGHGTGSADPASATAGTEITLTAAPNAGYHFKEWQVMSGDVTVRDDKFTMPSDNVEIKAIFEEDAPPTPTEYTVTFDGNDGTPSVDSMTTTKQKLTSLPDASRSKHSFNGWYTEKSGGTKITTDTVFSANTTVYAHWTHTGDNNPPVNYYTLRFETGGGSAIPGVQETYNTYIDLTKYVPTRHGYTFVGWYSERSLVNKVSDIYLTGDRTVYAGWRAVTIPQTGDSGQMNLWSTALCASFAGCVALIVWKIRRREKKSL